MIPKNLLIEVGLISHFISQNILFQAGVNVLLLNIWLWKVSEQSEICVNEQVLQTCQGLPVMGSISGFSFYVPKLHATAQGEENPLQLFICQMFLYHLTDNPPPLEDDCMPPEDDPLPPEEDPPHPAEDPPPPAEDPPPIAEDPPPPEIPIGDPDLNHHNNNNNEMGIEFPKQR